MIIHWTPFDEKSIQRNLSPRWRVSIEISSFKLDRFDYFMFWKIIKMKQGFKSLNDADLVPKMKHGISQLTSLSYLKFSNAVKIRI